MTIAVLIALIGGVVVGLVVGLIYGAGLVAQRTHAIAVAIRGEVEALVPSDEPISYRAGFETGAKVALAELVNRLDTPRR